MEIKLCDLTNESPRSWVSCAPSSPARAMAPEATSVKQGLGHWGEGGCGGTGFAGGLGFRGFGSRVYGFRV